MTPIAYALLPNKNEVSYTRMLRLIRNAWPALKPASIVMDFEKAMMNAVKECFPLTTRLDGCFFHLFKNVKKRLVREGLMSRYFDLISWIILFLNISGSHALPPSYFSNH